MEFGLHTSLKATVLRVRPPGCAQENNAISPEEPLEMLSNFMRNCLQVERLLILP
jgi:hypothetical protein